MIYAYIRVSTGRQTISHQRFEIRNYIKKNNIVVEKWIEEKISSRKPLKKRKLGLLLEELKNGDILISCELSRLGRSLMEVMGILEMCLKKNCQVWTIKENYKLGNDIQSQVLAFAFGLSAQIERDLISQRTKMSLDHMKATGQKLGRPLGAQSKELKLSHNVRKIKNMLNQGLTKKNIARPMKVQPITLRRFLRRNNIEREMPPGMKISRLALGKDIIKTPR